MRWIPLLVGALLVARPGIASASDNGVCVEGTSGDAVVTQTMHRVGGELGAAGFEVTFPKETEAPACGAGRIVLEVVNSNRLDIVATSGDDETKVVVTLNLDAASRSAEMFAVRAVEALRAAMLQRVRLHPDERVAEPLRAFTRIAREKVEASSSSEKAKRSGETGRKESPLTAPKGEKSAPARVLFGLGPRLGLDAGETSFLLGADLAVLWRGLWIGARGDFRPLGIRFEGREGTIDVTSYAFGASLGARVFRSDRFAFYVGAKVDYRLVELRAVLPNGGTTWVRHRSADPGIFGWFGYSFSARSGVALAIDGGFFVSSPEIHYDERVVSFGRPSFSLGPELFFEF